MQYHQTLKLNQPLIEELEHALEMVKAYGSIEIYVQDSQVTQITVRNIKKTKVNLNSIQKKYNGKSAKFVGK